MGNSQRVNQDDETASQIAKKKNEIEFVQDDFIRQIQGNIKNEYQILSPSLKSNEFYELRKVIHKKTHLVRSLFIVNKYKIRSQERQLLEQQISKLKKIDHPYLVKIYQLFKDSHQFYIVCQLCGGDSLATLLQNEGSLTQRHAAKIMKQILSALDFCHRHNVIHTDLKFQNIMFNSKKQDVLKISDFSIARILRIQEVIEQSKNKIFLGAPETLTNQYSAKSDVWSCGIILYTLLCGEAPFLGKSKKKMLQKLTFYQPQFTQTKFQFVSKEARNLIRKMLQIQPNERFSARQCLQHTWFQKFYEKPKVSDSLLKRCLMQIYNYHPSSKLQQASWAFFVNVLVSFEEKQAILKVFQKLDRSLTGQITSEDLFEGFLKLFDENRAREMTEQIKKKHKNSIKFSQFVTLCTNRRFLLSDTNLLSIFRMIDTDSSGQISVSELKNMLGSSKEVTEEVWMELMKEADANSDGKISLEEFYQMMKSLQTTKSQLNIKEYGQC